MNAKPIFIDVDLDTFGLCPDSLHKFLKEECILKSEGTFNKKTGKRIRACIPMHTFGFVNNIEKIIKICNDWKIKVVEDAAEAFEAQKKENMQEHLVILESLVLMETRLLRLEVELL